jgi:UDPglucose--hexose-1-phosphate uridylyltransferase
MLQPDGSPQRLVSATGLVSMPGIGHHEVIIESPSHDADLARVDVAAVRDVLEAYRARYRALRAQHRGVILLFRNHGPGAGTSIAHPHSQIVATPVVPIQVRHRFEVAMQHYDDLGTSLYLDILDHELRDGRRIVLETDDYVAFQPFASAVPYETWIMPRWLQPSFGDATDVSLDALAPVLRAVLAGLSAVLGDPDYHAIVHSAPVGDEESTSPGTSASSRDCSRRRASSSGRAWPSTRAGPRRPRRCCGPLSRGPEIHSVGSRLIDPRFTRLNLPANVVRR